MEFVLAPVLGLAAGLNPYVTLAIASVVAWRSSLYEPPPGLEFVGSPTLLLLALALLPIDLFADKFPGSGGFMDRVGWVLRPLTGGLLGGAAIGAGGPGILAGLALGVIAAGLTHGLRLRVRRRVQWRMLGFGRMVFGAYGDFGSGIVALTALLAPPVGAVVAATFVGLALVADRRWGLPEGAPASDADPP